MAVMRADVGGQSAKRGLLLGHGAAVPHGLRGQQLQDHNRAKEGRLPRLFRVNPALDHCAPVS